MKDKAKEKMNFVFMVSLIIVAAISLWGIIAPTGFGEVANGVFAFLTTNFGWFYLLAMFFFVVFMLGIAFSKFGNIRLGADDSKPEYSYIELPIPPSDLVPIAPALTKEELAQAEVAIVTSGGIVPVGNPDRIQSASATKWGKYDISKLDDLVEGEYMTIHAGFDPAAANADSDVIVPLDAMRAYEKEGKIKGVYKYFYSTVGTGTTQAEAARMGREIAAELVEAGVKAVVFTST